MANERMDGIAYRYSGVSFFLPDEIDKSHQIKLKAIPDWIPIQTEDFTLIRIIANIALCIRGTNEVSPEFEKPIELQIRYTLEDLEEADGEENLKLAYWDLHDWVIISDSDHEYEIFPGQIGKVRIKSWGADPTLAWGK